MIKFTILLVRRKGLSHEDYVLYHQNNHAPLFAALPEVKEYVRRYVQSYSFQETMPGLPPPIYDGITELWFDTVADIAKVFNSADYMSTIRPDEEKFLDLHACSFLVSTEKVVIE